jgi:hypothetical protein
LKEKESRFHCLGDEIHHTKRFIEMQDHALKERNLNEYDGEKTNTNSKDNNNGWDFSSSVGSPGIENARLTNSQSNQKRLLNSKSSGKMAKYGTINLEVKDSKSFHFNMDVNTPKVKNGSKEFSNSIIAASVIELGSSTRSMARTQSTTTFTSPTSSINNISSTKSSTTIINPVDRSSFTGNDSQLNIKLQQSTTKSSSSNTPSNSCRMLLIQDRNKLNEMLKELEVGLILYKKFSSNTTFGVKNDNVASMDQIQKNYGKRVIKISKMNKSIEILKYSAPVSRYSAEYNYEWKALKKVFIPPKTMEIIKQHYNYMNGKNANNTTAGSILKRQLQDENCILPFALDVHNKGRIEFITTDIKVVIVIYNIVCHIIDGNGLLKW